MTIIMPTLPDDQADALKLAQEQLNVDLEQAVCRFIINMERTAIPLPTAGLTLIDRFLAQVVIAVVATLPRGELREEFLSRVEPMVRGGVAQAEVIRWMAEMPGSALQ